MADILISFTEDQALDVVVGDAYDAHTPPRVAQIDGPLEWSTSDANVVSVQVDPSDASGKKCALVSGVPGDWEVTIRGDANKDPNVKDFIVYVIGGKILPGEAGPAVGFGVTLGTPRPK